MSTCAELSTNRLDQRQQAVDMQTTQKEKQSARATKAKTTFHTSLLQPHGR